MFKAFSRQGRQAARGRRLFSVLPTLRDSKSTLPRSVVEETQDVTAMDELLKVVSKYFSTVPLSI